MKNIKKLVGMLLTLVMAFSMLLMTASAADVTVDREFYAYKILDATVDASGSAYSYTVPDKYKTKLIAAVNAADTGASVADGDGVIAWLAADGSNTEAFAREMAKQLAGEGPDATLTSASPTDLAKGYWLLVDPASSNKSAVIIDTVANDNWTVTAKLTDTTVEKVVGDPGAAGSAAYEVGTEIPFTITATLPTNAEAYAQFTAYNVAFADTLSAGLTLKQDTVKIEKDHSGTKEDITSQFTITKSATGFTTTPTDVKAASIGAVAGDKIVITYTATINENSVSTNPETNDVTVTYSNDPTDTTSTNTDTDKTYSHTVDLRVFKYYEGDMAVEIPLTGAEFILSKDDQGITKYLVIHPTTNAHSWTDTKASATVMTSEADGYLTFPGLADGTYKLEEIKAPAGYNKIDVPIEVTIATTLNADGTVNSVSVTGATYDATTKTATAAVENQSGSELPSTGGMGTTILYIVGGILVVMAGVLLVTRKKVRQ